MKSVEAIVLACLWVCSGVVSAFAGEHRPEVREDWAFQHRYAVTTDKTGNLGLRQDRQPAPLVDAQAGTLKSDRDPTDQVARRTDALLAYLAKAHPERPCWREFRKRLDPLLAEAKAGKPDLTGKDPARQQTYTALCALRREIALANPLLDFEQILFSEESDVGRVLTRTTTGQFNGLGAMEPGGSLYLIKRWKDSNPELVDLCKDAKVENGPYKGRTLAGGAFHAPSLSFDGQSVLFSWAPLHYAEGEKRGNDLRGAEKRKADPLRIFRINVDGAGLRQITTDEGPWNDTEPCELPDGRILFMSTRREVYDRCECCRPAFTLCSMKPDGTDIIKLSFHETHEWLPSVANDGKILYTRWDYVDRATWASHGFWTCFPDGRDPRAPNGNYYGRKLFKDGTPYAAYNQRWVRDQERRQPMAISHVHAIPGSRKVMGIGSSHHPVELGPVLLLDLDLPDDYMGGQVFALTPGFWGGDGSSNNLWSSPWPLSEDFFLANCLDRLYLADRFGNRELIHRIPWRRNQARLYNNALYGREGWHNQCAAAEKEGKPVPPKPDLADFAADDPLRMLSRGAEGQGGLWRPVYPRPVRPRPRPPVIPAQTYQSEDRRGKPGHQPATIVIQNVYDTDIPLPPGARIAKLRIVQVLGHSSGNYTRVGHNSNSSPKLVLGTVPVEADGSVYCLAPIEKGIYFQLLDEDGLAVHSMKSVTYVHPGERLSCRGCHERYSSAPPPLRKVPLAMQRPPSPVTPEGPGGKLMVLDDYLKPAAARVLAAASKLPGGPPADGRSLEREGWVWQFRCNVIHAPPDTRTTPDAFGARKSKIWDFVQKNKDVLDGLEPDDLRLFALWLDLLCVDYSYSARNSVKDASGYAWPLHPDLDVNNPLGLEIVPKIDNRQVLSVIGERK
jgi:hypothetical protein